MSVKSLIVAIFLVLGFSSTAMAQSGPVGSMNKFYDKSKKSNITTTSAGAYQSQSRYALTGGSFVWRAEQENIVALTAELPSINAGCGGIDIFAGSFSFINGDQIEALFRAILQDAAGYAFSLALKTISPQISSTADSMMDMIREVNGKNINSCEIATTLVDSTIERVNAAKSKTCSVTAPATGLKPDSISGRGCGDKDAADANAAAKDADPNHEVPENQNFAMHATSKSSIKDDFDLREFMMSITGTLVISTGDETKYDFFPAINLDESVVRALMTGDTITGHKCLPVSLGSRNYTAEECLKVQQGGNPIDIPSEDAFLVLVRETLSSIYDKAAGDNDASYSADELAFIQDTPLPVLRAAQLFSLTYPEVGKSMLLSYSELIAYNITLKFLENTSRAVLEGAASNTAANQEELQTWRNSVNRNIEALQIQQGNLQLRFNAVQNFVAQLREMEDRYTASVNANLLRSAGSAN